jgi:hypothetical protein
MRSAHRFRATAHLVLGTALVGFSLRQLDQHPESFSWFPGLCLGFLGVALELPELARHEDATFDAEQVAALRRAFEAHCRQGGWHDADLMVTQQGHYARVLLNEGWERWLAQAERTRSPKT